MKSPVRYLTPVFALCVTASLGIAAGPVFWHVMGQTSDKTAEVIFAVKSTSVAPASVDLVSAVALAPFGSAEQKQRLRPQRLQRLTWRCAVSCCKLTRRFLLH